MTVIGTLQNLFNHFSLPPMAQLKRLFARTNWNRHNYVVVKEIKREHFDQSYKQFTLVIYKSTITIEAIF